MEEILYTTWLDIMKSSGFMCTTANCWGVNYVLKHNNKWYCPHCLMNKLLYEWKKRLCDNWYDPNIHASLCDYYNNTLKDKVFKYEHKFVLCYGITKTNEDGSFSCIIMPFHGVIIRDVNEYIDGEYFCDDIVHIHPGDFIKNYSFTGAFFYETAAMSKTTFYVGGNGFYMHKNYTRLTDEHPMLKTMLFDVRARCR